MTLVHLKEDPSFNLILAVTQSTNPSCFCCAPTVSTRQLGQHHSSSQFLVTQNSFFDHLPRVCHFDVSR